VTAVAPANPRHSKATNRWGTPAEWVEMSRWALGGRIERDPMSSPEFNATVRAERFWNAEDDCFAQPHWKCDTMFLNPPGGLVVEAWRRLVAEVTAGNVGAAIWIGFSVEQLNILALESCHPHDFSLLTCRNRISFVRHDGYVGSPGHANYVVGLGIAVDVFERAFAGRGRFDHGRLAMRDGEGFGA
jgi:hypothetical protein